jgi:hypothetical protein
MKKYQTGNFLQALGMGGVLGIVIIRFLSGQVPGVSSILLSASILFAAGSLCHAIESKNTKP